MIKNITIVSCHSREGGNLDTCFRRYDTKFVSPNSIGFTIYHLNKLHNKLYRFTPSKNWIFYGLCMAFL
ncbi:hypothetical protein [Candidatus Tisiphia endosymbiont of Hybos culiciformis]|uniref:hypothetical protein n=1 Tax=Candidatus Tisiphia endosymbiont of Hybos culiciformis TaxID=3139331 RepID=UPI003CCB0F98